MPELKGDSSKARKELMWVPETKFEKLLTMMVKSDITKYEKI